MLLKDMFMINYSGIWRLAISGDLAAYAAENMRKKEDMSDGYRSK